MSSGGTRDLFFGQASTNNNSLRLRYYWEANNSSKNRICIGFPNNTTDNNPIHIDNSRVQINTNLVCPNISTEYGGTNLQTQLNNKSDVGHTHTASNITDFLNKVYPIGAVYISMSSNNPKFYFGGTWQRLPRGRMLINTWDPFAEDVGDTSDPIDGDYTPLRDELNPDPVSTGTYVMGGESKHTLTVNEIPSHNHQQYCIASVGGSNGWRADWNADNGNATNYPQTMTGSTGGGGAHNNLPPYITVYMWVRTA
jgi:hypothetical protein